jgi:hypothetical protein
MTSAIETPGAAAVESLLALEIQIRRACSFALAEGIERSVFDVTGGHFEGAALRGRVLPSGGDWVLRSAGVSKLDVRLVLETDDGVIILLSYGGRACRRGNDFRVEIAVNFEAPPGRYDWLNTVQAFGLGFPGTDHVRYQICRFS